jgi:hypothetical protein
MTEDIKRFQAFASSLLLDDKERITVLHEALVEIDPATRERVFGLAHAAWLSLVEAASMLRSKERPMTPSLGAIVALFTWLRLEDPRT